MKTSAWVVFSLTALGGCHADTGAPAAAAPAAHAHAAGAAKGGPPAQESTEGMVEAAEIGKSALAVTVKFELASRPEVGRPANLGIALLSGVAGGPASVQVTGSDGASLAEAGSHVDLPTVEVHGVYRQAVTVTPTAEGVQLVTVNVMLHHDGLSETRVFAIPLIVGEGDGVSTVAPAGTAALPASGQGVSAQPPGPR